MAPSLPIIGGTASPAKVAPNTRRSPSPAGSSFEKKHVTERDRIQTETTYMKLKEEVEAQEKKLNAGDRGKRRSSDMEDSDWQHAAFEARMIVFHIFDLEKDGDLSEVLAEKRKYIAVAGKLKEELRKHAKVDAEGGFQIAVSAAGGDTRPSRRVRQSSQVSVDKSRFSEDDSFTKKRNTRERHDSQSSMDGGGQPTANPLRGSINGGGAERNAAAALEARLRDMSGEPAPAPAPAIAPPMGRRGTVAAPSMGRRGTVAASMLAGARRLSTVGKGTLSAPSAPFPPPPDALLDAPPPMLARRRSSLLTALASRGAVSNREAISALRDARRGTVRPGRRGSFLKSLSIGDNTVLNLAQPTDARRDERPGEPPMLRANANLTGPPPSVGFDVSGGQPTIPGRKKSFFQKFAISNT